MNQKETSEKSLKACMVYYQYFGSLLYREAMALQEGGFEVDIICLRNSKKENVIEKFDNINLYQIQTRTYAEKNPIFYFLKLGLFFFKSFLFLTILGFFKRYNLIHVTAPPDVMVFNAIIPKIIGAKIILDIHDIGPELYMRKLGVGKDKQIIRFLKFLEKISGIFADHVIIVTDLWRDKLIARSVPPEKCSVLLNVPDENIFSPLGLKDGQKSSNKFNLFYHGSLEEHFGVDTLLKSMLIINEKASNITLHIYSGKKGRLYNEFKDFVQKNEMTDCVTYHDYVPFYELPMILKDADIGIVPTKGGIFSSETISMKSLEYISLGIPIIITSTDAHKYYFNDSMVKFFKPGCHKELADCVLELFRKPEMRQKMITNSKTFIEKNGWREAKKGYLDTVNKLVKKKRVKYQIN